MFIIAKIINPIHRFYNSYPLRKKEFILSKKYKMTKKLLLCINVIMLALSGYSQYPPVFKSIYGNNPKTGHYANIRGFKMYYEIYGKGEPLLLIHGNGGSKTEQIQDLINKTMEVDGFRVMPIINNEDDHFDFEKETNNLTTSLKNYVSWGYFDYRLRGETNIIEGYQTVPVDWGINSQRKKAFFEKIKEITGGFQK